MASFCHKGTAPSRWTQTQRLLPKAIALQRRRQTLAPSTVEQYCEGLRGSLREILNLKPKSVEGQRLLKRYQKIRDHLLPFLTDETIPPINNASEQALRWNVIFRKVTNGFRSDWGADLLALNMRMKTTIAFCQIAKTPLKFES